MNYSSVVLLYLLVEELRLVLLLAPLEIANSSSEKCSKMLCSFVFLNNLSTTSDETSSSGCNETALLTSGSVSSAGGWMTNMLMVTTTMRMLDWVHSNTSNSWPVLSLSSGFEPGVGSLEEWLVASLSTGDDTNHTS